MKSNRASVCLKGACSHPAHVTQIATACGFALLDEEGVTEARAMAVTMLGEAIAPLQSYAALLRVVGSGVFGYREGTRLTGLNASFPMNQAGHAALREGRFDTINLDTDLLSRPGEKPSAYYGWGILGSTRRGAGQVILLSRSIHRRLFWATPTYARTVTGDGRRACISMGFVEAPGKDPDLLWIPPQTFAPEAGLGAHP